MRNLMSTPARNLFSCLLTALVLSALSACGRDTEFVTVIPDETQLPDADGDEQASGEGEGEGNDEGEGEAEEDGAGEGEGGEGEADGEGEGPGDVDEVEPACASSFQTPAVTQVSGALTADTVWTLAGSPYEVTGTVVVPDGVHLTIDPGVEVRSAMPDGVDEFPLLFAVRGTVDAQGTLDAPIVFDGNCSAAFFSGRLEEGEELPIGRATFSRVVLRNARSFWTSQGVFVGSSFSLRDSRVENISEVSFVWYPEQDVAIENNLFVEAAGFSIGHSDANVFVRGNRFVSFHPLLRSAGEPGSFDSAFWVENWAAYFGTTTVVEQNAFLTTGDVAVQLPAGFEDGALIATNNFWGTTDGSVISEMIFDANDDELSAGLIDASPVLSDIPLGVPAE